jgi:hypothetical protein
MEREINQKTKASPNWQAISSLILGVISLPLGMFLGIIGAGLPAWLGFIFGVMGLKSPARYIAMVGIVLCITGFVIGVHWVHVITTTR